MLVQATLLVYLLALFFLLWHHNTAILPVVLNAIELVFVVLVDATLRLGVVEVLSEEVVGVPFVDLGLLVHLHTVLKVHKPVPNSLVALSRRPHSMEVVQVPVEVAGRIVVLLKPKEPLRVLPEVRVLLHLLRKDHRLVHTLPLPACLVQLVEV
mmetsp:Transcript_43195/g.41533  ORF Transcript_43195/g.41533 Transcript_43195/m.41533 type:complete len:154 (+) Transcript_43195:377-838(+)